MKRLAAVMFLSTLALLNAVKADLSARRYAAPATPGDPFVLSADANDPKLFEDVTFYGNRNLKQALEQLRIVNNRICLIVPLADLYTDAHQGNTVSLERASEFMLMIGDKDFSIDAGKMTPTAQSPGVLGLKDLAVAALTQRQYVIRQAGLTYRVVFVPREGAVLQFDWADKKSDDQTLVGRECWNQIFRANNLGVQRINVGRV